MFFCNFIGSSNSLLKRLTLYLLCFFVTGKVAFATHIVGGEMYYTKTGTNTYSVTLKVYRDCFGGVPPFDGQNGTLPALLHIFNNNGTLLNQLDLGIPVVTPVPPSINNPCIQTPGGVCVEEGRYTITLTLPPLAGGYHLVYQRCCRNNTILNLTNPGAAGATYKAFIPGPELVADNSSPRFNNFPPIFICNGIPISFDHAATDPDGDDLVYSLCPAFSGLDACCPIVGNSLAPNNTPMCVNPPAICPNAASPPPYPPVNYQGTFSGGYPVASNPSLTVNSTTGYMSGTPNLNGQWVVNVCVQEFRNGQLLSTHYRDFQFNVVTCSITVISVIAEQASKCMGFTIPFTSQSIGASSYKWDFGVIEIFNDTSNVINPTYTYQDTGTYFVTLIANPGKPCADTTVKKVFVYPTIDIQFDPQPLQCLKNNSYHFDVKGTFINAASFNWDFGDAATPKQSTDKSPSNVVFSEPGKFFVKLVGKQYTCIDSFIDSIRVLDRPKALIENLPTALCDPASVFLSNASISEYPASYLWQTSNGGNYQSFDANHVFSPAGVYSVSLTLVRGAPCPDTSQTSINTITVNPSPRADFIFSPTLTTIFDPEIYFENNSSPDAVSFFYDFADGNTSSFMNEKNVYQKHGTYPVSLSIKNRFNCTDKIIKDVKILPEFRFWIPNTFTPNGDGLNDVYMPISIGILDYTFEIFDRWGEKIFVSNEPYDGWDGTFKGVKCKQDVYVWRISYFNEVNRKNELKTGHVLLLNNGFE